MRVAVRKLETNNTLLLSCMNHDLFVPVEEDMSIAIETARLALGKIAIDAHYLSRNVLFVNSKYICQLQAV